MTQDPKKKRVVLQLDKEDILFQIQQASEILNILRDEENYPTWLGADLMMTVRKDGDIFDLKRSRTLSYAFNDRWRLRAHMEYELSLLEEELDRTKKALGES